MAGGGEVQLVADLPYAFRQIEQKDGDLLYDRASYPVTIGKPPSASGMYSSRMLLSDTIKKTPFRRCFFCLLIASVLPFG